MNNNICIIRHWNDYSYLTLPNPFYQSHINKILSPSLLGRNICAKRPWLFYFTRLFLLRLLWKAFWPGFEHRLTIYVLKRSLRWTLMVIYFTQSILHKVIMKNRLDSLETIAFTAKPPDRGKRPKPFYSSNVFSFVKHSNVSFPFKNFN